MSAIDNLKKDVRAALAVARELGELTDGVVGALNRWFSDVEFSMPLPEMPLSVEEKRDLTITALEDMLTAIDATPTTDDIEEAFDQLAPIVDPLWREVVHIRAEVINAEFEEMQQQMAARARSFDSPEEFVEHLTGLPIDEVLERAESNTQLNNLLRRLGILPE